MTQNEFIRQLEGALKGKVSEQVIRDNVEYYNGYISAQLAAGRTLEDVLGGLGNPRLIAKTIIDTSEPQADTGSDEGRRDGWSFGWIRGPEKDSWVWKAVTAVIVIAVIVLILKFIFSVISFLFKPAVVILAIVAVYYLVTNARKGK